MKKIATITLISITIVFLLITFGCNTAQPQKSDRINVVVSIQPQLEYVEKIGSERITASAMIPPGASPHTYEPLPSQITSLATADIYAEVGSGVEFELAWLDKLTATNSKMLLVDCSRGIDLIKTGEHQNNDGDEHHGAYDPHIWVSPQNAIIMAQNIKDGLKTSDPTNSDLYENNFFIYRQELMEVDSNIRASLGQLENKSFITYHPSFAYFARDYGLDVITIEEEGKEPSAADITRLIETGKEKNIKIVVTSPQFNPQSAQTVAREIGGNTVEIDVLSANYIENLKYLISVMVKAQD
jgi:zinc transport system substrate-binding protein